MKSSLRLLPLGASLLACGSSPPPTLGDARELLVRAVRVGIDAKENPQPVSRNGQNTLEGSGDSWVGPCNCLIRFGYEATLEHRVKTVQLGLFDCRKNAALDRVFSLVDPLFQRDDDRAAFHALLASPPRIDGADPGASISAKRVFSATVVRGTWEPVVWKEFPLHTAEDQAFAEETVMLWIEPRTKDDDTEETKASDLNFSSNGLTPRRCRDGSTRPWERK